MPLNKRRQYNIENDFGFSITDLMVAIAVIAIIATIATPNIKGLIQGYKLKMAASDLISYVNMAKARAAKDNRQWNIDLSPIGFNGYQVYYNDENGNKVAVKSVNFDTCTDKLTFDKCYGNIEYKSPDSTNICLENEFVFFPNGLTNICSATIALKQHENYYRVSLLAASGIIRTQKWDGSNWE